MKYYFLHTAPFTTQFHIGTMCQETPHITLKYLFPQHNAIDFTLLFTMLYTKQSNKLTGTRLQRDSGSEGSAWEAQLSEGGVELHLPA